MLYFEVVFLGQGLAQITDQKLGRIAAACVNMIIWVECTATQISRGIEEEGDTALREVQYGDVCIK